MDVPVPKRDRPLEPGDPRTSRFKGGRQKARLTVCLTASFQAPDQDGVQAGRPFSRQVEGDQQPYGPRYLVATEAWTKLDFGWLRPEQVGLVLLDNQGEHALEVCLRPGAGGPEADLVVLPGECQPLTAARPGLMELRAAVLGKVKLVLTAFPR